MKFANAWNKLRAAALAAGLALAGAGTAHAIIYTGNWDPLFGPTLPFLSFSGNATLYVPDACVARGPNSASGFVTNFESSCTQIPAQEASDPIRLLSASVTLTDIRDNSFETINFLVGYTPAELASLVFGVYIDFAVGSELDGVLIGASTDYIGPRPGSIDASKTGLAINDFYLRFGPEPFAATGARLGANLVPDDYRQAYLLAVGSGGPINGGVLSNPARVNYSVAVSTVPEPGSLGLVFAALGAGWLALRRRR